MGRTVREVEIDTDDELPSGARVDRFGVSEDELEDILGAIEEDEARSADGRKVPRRKKMIPRDIETRAAETVSTLDNLVDDFSPSVSDIFSRLADEYDAAKAAADRDGGAWFETEPGRRWLDTFRQMLVDHYKAVFNVRGSAVLDELGIEAVFDLANPEAIAALEAFGLDRVTGMNDTTIDILSDTIAAGIEYGKHPNDIARDIRDMIAGMTKDRSETIARTETAFAYSHAAIETYRRNGVTRKLWLTAEDEKVDPPCDSHEAEGSIPIDQEFGGSDQHPPAHPRCRCALLADVDSVPDDAPTWTGD